MTTDKTGKLTFWQKASWGLGAGASTIMANAHGYLAMPIYQIALGVDPVLLGIAMGVPRLIDAITDPIMGYISDNTKSRFGRRRPFIFIGAILSAILFFLMWLPPVSFGTTGIALYFLVISILYYIAYTIFVIPWGALGYELTQDYTERTNVQAFNIFIQAVFGLSLGFMWKISMVFGKNEIEGVRVVGVIFGVIILVTAILPAITSREKTVVQTHKKISFTSSIKETMKNGPFMKLCLVTLLMFLGIFLVNPFAAYININYVFGPDNKNVYICDIQKLKEVVGRQGSGKIIDAVITQRAGEVISIDAYKKASMLAAEFSFPSIEREDFVLVPQDVSKIKDGFTASELEETIDDLIVKNLKTNFSFFDIKQLLSNDTVDFFLQKVSAVSAGDIGGIEQELRAAIAETKKIITDIEVSDADKLPLLSERYSVGTLQSIMVTASYVQSKDSVSTFNIWGNVAFQAVMLMSIPLTTLLSAKFGKKAMYMCGLVFVLVGFLSSWYSYSPRFPYVQCLTLGCLGAGLASIFTIGQSIVADVCDIDELRTGTRREGMFNAMFTWTIKAGIAGTLILSGFVLNMTGYTSSAIFRFQDAEIIEYMRKFYMIAPAMAAVFSIFIIAKTPISEKHMKEVRIKLDELK